KPDGSMALQAIDPNYEKYRLPSMSEAVAPKPNPIDQWLRQNSRVYTWLDEQWWRVAIFLERKLYGRSAVAPGSDRIVRNAHFLAQRPEYSYVLDDWN